MPVEIVPKSAHYKVKPIPGMEQVLYEDIFATPKVEGISSPLTSSFFALFANETPQGRTPVYSFDETGIVVKGELKLTDEKDVTHTLTEGDTFFVGRGSRMIFNTDNFVLLFKVAARWKGEM